MTLYRHNFLRYFLIDLEALRSSLAVENLGHLERLMQRMPKHPVVNESSEWQR